MLRISDAPGGEGIFACPTCTHVGFRMLRISDALPCGRVSCASPTHLVERGCLRMPHVHARGVSRVTHLRCASGRSGCPAHLRRAWLRGGVFVCPTCVHVGFDMLRISDALPMRGGSETRGM